MTSLCFSRAGDVTDEEVYAVTKTGHYPFTGANDVTEHAVYTFTRSNDITGHEAYPCY